MKKDDYLSMTMNVPQKQRVKILPFDLRTQSDAFSVSLEGLKGVSSCFILTSSVLLGAVECERTRPRIRTGTGGQEKAQRAQTAC